MLRLLHALLRLFLVLDGSIEELFSILLTHLRLLLLLLLLVLLLLLLVLLLLIFLIFLLLLILVLLVLLVLLLLLLLTLAEHQVVACLVIVGIQAEGLFVGLDGLSIHLMALTDDTHVMEGLVLALRVGLELGSTLKLYDGGRVFLLSHQGIAQVIGSLRIAGILLHCLPVAHLRIGEVAGGKLFVALAHILAVGLGVSRGER